jgi:hypothetical protein
MWCHPSEKALWPEIHQSDFGRDTEEKPNEHGPNVNGTTFALDMIRSKVFKGIVRKSSGNV